MFKVGEVDVRDLERFGNMIGALGQDGPKAVNRALNRTGDMARTRVVRELAKQTGLPQKTIRKAVKVKRSSWQDLEYRLSSESPRFYRRPVASFYATISSTSCCA